MKKAILLGLAWFFIISFPGKAQGNSSGTKRAENPGDPTLLSQTNPPVEFDQSVLEKYREDPDFAYSQPPPEQTGIFRLIFQEALEWLAQLLGHRGVAKFFLWLLILIFLAGFGWTLVLIFGGSPAKIIYNPENGKIAYSVEEENLDKIDFNAQIAEALHHGLYRKAIRLIYLHAIKLLAGKALIDWKPWKTNRDYLGELKPQDLKAGFSELSYFFDYVWYGDFEADKPLCDQAMNVFQQLRKNLGEH